MWITAASALTNAGSPAIPILIKALHNADSIVRQAAGDRLVRFTPQELAAVVPDLAAALSDPNSRETALKCLERIGPRAQAVMPKVAEEDPNTRGLAREAVTCIESARDAAGSSPVQEGPRLLDGEVPGTGALVPKDGGAI